ncbi:hypothetical protein [Microcoleus sp. CAWBG58]|uniref:hypothetical protein n=1 Tax=Microcoleus sp. CAWBG58 TaxID=2841651 RepID=UPI0025FE1D66|nr:hypothetical protein [Microcoleus sp. CAWBG58]
MAIFIIVSNRLVDFRFYILDLLIGVRSGCSRVMVASGTLYSIVQFEAGVRMCDRIIESKLTFGDLADTVP